MVTKVAELSVPANAAQAQRWNGASGQYWIAHRERHLAEHQNLTPHLFRAAGISPGERVLDVGCGCGGTTIAAARAARAARGEAEDGPAGRSPGSGQFGMTGRAVGLDLSGLMLQVARQLAVRAHAANAAFVRSDAQACPLRRNSFDVMISNFGVMFFDNPGMAFASIASTVRPHGRLAFLCWQDDTHNEVFAIPLRAFGAHMPLPPPASGDLFVDPRKITSLLSSTGWADVQIASVTEPAWIGSDVDDVMSYIRGMPTTRNLAASLADEPLTEQILAAIAEQYAARQRPDGVWVRAAAWLVTALRA